MTTRDQDEPGDQRESGNRDPNDKSRDEGDDYATETVFPGDKLTVALVKRPDPKYPSKPYSAEFDPHRGARYTRRYSTAKEAEEDIETAQRRSLFGCKESDRSMYD
jgi:hypothetical protein